MHRSSLMTGSRHMLLGLGLLVVAAAACSTSDTATPSSSAPAAASTTTVAASSTSAAPTTTSSRPTTIAVTTTAAAPAGPLPDYAAQGSFPVGAHQYTIPDDGEGRPVEYTSTLG